MQKYTHFENLLFSFCQRHKVAMIQPDANLHYVLFVDNIEVRCFSDASSIYLQVEIADIPQPAGEHRELYMQLMQQSLLDCFSSNCVVSLNHKNWLTVYQKLPLDQCRLQDFEASMEALANQVDTYCESLLSYGS